MHESCVVEGSSVYLGIKAEPSNIFIAGLCFQLAGVDRPRIHSGWRPRLQPVCCEAQIQECLCEACGRCLSRPAHITHPSQCVQTHHSNWPTRSSWSQGHAELSRLMSAEARKWTWLQPALLKIHVDIGVAKMLSTYQSERPWQMQSVVKSGSSRASVKHE